MSVWNRKGNQSFRKRWNEILVGGIVSKLISSYMSNSCWCVSFAERILRIFLFFCLCWSWSFSMHSRRWRDTIWLQESSGRRRFRGASIIIAWSLLFSRTRAKIKHYDTDIGGMKATAPISNSWCYDDTNVLITSHQKLNFGGKKESSSCLQWMKIS